MYVVYRNFKTRNVMLGVMGLKIITLSQEPVNNKPIVKLKILYKIS